MADVSKAIDQPVPTQNEDESDAAYAQRVRKWGIQCRGAGIQLQIANDKRREQVAFWEMASTTVWSIALHVFGEALLFLIFFELVIPRAVRAGNDLSQVQIQILAKITSTSEGDIRNRFAEYTRRHPEYALCLSPSKRRNMNQSPEDAILNMACLHFPEVSSWQIDLIRKGAFHFIDQTFAALNLSSMIPPAKTEEAFLAVTIVSFLSARADIQDDMPVEDPKARKFNGVKP